MADHQSGSLIESGETLTLSLDVRRGEELGYNQFDHPVIDQAHQPKLLGDRHHGRGRHDAAVGAANAHEAFVEGRLAA